jgi:membrane protease YdiL (CAAX protease family)
VNGWRIKDLGLTTEILNRNVWIFAILIAVIINIVSLMFVSPTPAPVLFLLVALYQNIFLEEFYFRGVIQSKLERAWVQNKAWIWGGIIFGLMHIVNDYAIPLLVGGDVGSVIIIGTLLLFIQTINGWFLGILYIKTRSLIPCIIVHFISNYLTAILAWFII